MEELNSGEPPFGSDAWDEKYHEPAIEVHDIFTEPMPPSALTGLALFQHLIAPDPDEVSKMTK